MAESKVREKNPRSSVCGVGWNSSAPAICGTGLTFTVSPLPLVTGCTDQPGPAFGMLIRANGQAGSSVPHGPSQQALVDLYKIRACRV